MGLNKYCCAELIPSSCVPFTGKKLKFLTDDEQPACDASINDVIDKIAIAIDDIEKAIDVTSHTANCITLTTPKTAKSVLQNHADKLCALDASLQALQSQLAALNVQDDLITINLGCLAPAASNCEVGTNNYTLISVLTLFKNEICGIKTHLGI